MIRYSLLNRGNWDKIAVIDEGKYYSYREIAQKATAVKCKLAYKERQNIAIFLPNSANYISALFGIIMAGMTAFPLNTRLTIHEIVPLIKQAFVSALVTSKAYQTLFAEIARQVPLELIYVEELTGLEQEPKAQAAKAGADEPMVLLTTSGTTGNAKLVQLSEANVAASTLAYIDKMDFAKIPKDQIRMILGTPFSSVYALMILTACVLEGLSIVVLKEAFTLDMLYRAAEEHKVTHYEGGVSVGLMMEQLAGRPISYDISSFRYFGLAGSKVSAATLSRLKVAYPGIEFWPGYGMTEAGPLIAKPDKEVNMDKLDSVGTKINCVTIRIAAEGTLTDAPYIKGEIAVKGPNVMLGYYKNPAATREIIREGYLYTGDIGYLDEAGYLYVCGRKKNVIIVRGFNVHAEEVEACILNSGLAKDCVVYAKTDAWENEIVCADIIPLNQEVQAAEIKAYCSSHLAGYKQPQSVKLVEAIGKTATGKTERS